MMCVMCCTPSTEIQRFRLIVTTLSGWQCGKMMQAAMGSSMGGMGGMKTFYDTCLTTR